MKKFLGLLPAVVCSMCAFVAVDEANAAKLGEANVGIAKFWQNDTEAVRPGSVFVNVGDEKVEVTAENGWEAYVSIDAFNADGSVKVCELSEDTIENYIATIEPQELAFSDFVLVDALDKVPNCNTLTKYLAGRNLAIFKKGYKYVVWTEEELTPGAKIALVDLVENCGIDDLVELKDIDFVYGYGQFDELGQNVVINEDGSINFEAHCTWSWFYRGFVALEQSEYAVDVVNTYVDSGHYEWVCVGEDSATGYDPQGRIAKGAWFMYNTIDVANMEEGETVTFPIQAGEWQNKKGAYKENFVGAYSVTKVADNWYEVAYEPAEVDATHKIVFDGPKFWVNNTGKFVTSPGNQKGNARAVNAGEMFNIAGGTIYVFAHFNASYWTLVEVE